MKERNTITRVDQLRNSRRALLAQEYVVKIRRGVIKLPRKEEKTVEPTERIYPDSRIETYTSEINLLKKNS